MKMSYNKEDLKRLCREHGMDDCSSRISEREEVLKKCK